MRLDASERGQASAELIAVVPILLFAAVAPAQAVVGGWALLSAGEAARAAARVAHLGGDARSAAGEALPSLLEPAEIELDGAEVHVQVRAPALIPGTPQIPVSASAALDPAAGP